jgi:hypothetical protein
MANVAFAMPAPAPAAVGFSTLETRFNIVTVRLEQWFPYPYR